MGRLVIGVLASFAEYEREDIIEKTKAGLRSRARAGEWPGGPVPFGFALEGLVRGSGGGGVRLAVDVHEAGVLRKAAGLIVDEGCSTLVAAKTLNALQLYPRNREPLSHGHLRRTLLAPALAGIWTYQQEGGWEADRRSRHR